MSSVPSIYNHKRKEKGLIAVELAYAFPFLLLVFMLMVFLCDLILVKHHLNVSLNQSLRVCASRTNGNAQQCINNLMIQQFNASKVDVRCAIDHVVILPAEDGLLISEVGCHYEGFAPLESLFLLSDGSLNDLNRLLDLRVSAAYPFNL